MKIRFGCVFFFILHMTWPQAALSRPNYFQTSFIVEPNSSELTWQNLGFKTEILIEAVRALKGESFSTRPPEWFHFFDQSEFEDEDSNCLRDPNLWRLTAGRASPIGTDDERPLPFLSLTFQPFCNLNSPEISSDTTIQLILNRPNEKDWSAELFSMNVIKKVTEQNPADFQDAGFNSFESISQKSEMPFVVRAEDQKLFALKIKALRKSGYHISEINWMASLSGQLDWVFGKLKADSESPRRFTSATIKIKNEYQNPVIDLGPFDFLPVFIREPFQSLSMLQKAQLDLRHVRYDPHDSPETAHEVLKIDELVSDPWQTSHAQSSCIQCHSAQERMGRTISYLKYGGAKEFGYFFRGLGLIENKPYVSWRSIQENRFLNEKITERHQKPYSQPAH